MQGLARKSDGALHHHGLTKPQPLNAVLAESLEKDGNGKTVALYHEPRSKYYGAGHDDFGETPLNLLTESLLSSRTTLMHSLSWNSTSRPIIQTRCGLTTCSRRHTR